MTHDLLNDASREARLNEVLLTCVESLQAGQVLDQWQLLAAHPANTMCSSSGDRLKGHYADRKHPLLHAVVNSGPTDLPPFDLTDVNLTKAELAEAEPAQKQRVGKPRFFINGKEVDAESAQKMMQGGPEKKIFRVEGGPEIKTFRLGGKQGDADPAQKKRESP
jgi:hypothetical protein